MAYTHWPASLPALQPACRPVCRHACLSAHRQANLPTGYSQMGRLKYNVETVWN
ncbi:hypothetical protein [Bacteroides caecicola]|uniref:hypothetical protein n=1 Tax=Bacteroides caecicola TaxID=1462569 RepID=UPI002011781B|nr:hypothetical protein [Bacteroides caecicola]MCL1625767.1 hypothetical protein [Bacteroides caecicola]